MRCGFDFDRRLESEISPHCSKFTSAVGGRCAMKDFILHNFLSTCARNNFVSNEVQSTVHASVTKLTVRWRRKCVMKIHIEETRMVLEWMSIPNSSALSRLIPCFEASSL
jgi:hypothetical protein